MNWMPRLSRFFFFFRNYLVPLRIHTKRNFISGSIVTSAFHKIDSKAMQVQELTQTWFKSHTSTRTYPKLKPDQFEYCLIFFIVVIIIIIIIIIFYFILFFLFIFLFLMFSLNSVHVIERRTWTHTKREMLSMWILPEFFFSVFQSSQ